MSSCNLYVTIMAYDSSIFKNVTIMSYDLYCFLCVIVMTYDLYCFLFVSCRFVNAGARRAAVSSLEWMTSCTTDLSRDLTSGSTRGHHYASLYFSQELTEFTLPPYDQISTTSIPAINVS